MALSLPLSNADWDLTLDSSGDLSMATPDESLAQDVACAIRTFLGECWYDVSLGMPYFQSIFGKRPPSSFVKARIVAAAKTAQDISGVDVTAIALSNRAITGTVVVTRIGSTAPITVSF